MKKEVKNITIKEIQELLLKKRACQLIDVRELPEYESVRIAGAKLIPLSELEHKFNLIDRNSPVYIHCGVGKRAEKAADYLASLGFNDLHVVSGGIKAWIEAGYPVEHGKCG